MDPSIARGAKTVQKIGIDATLAPSEIQDAPNPVPPRNSVSKEVFKSSKTIIEKSKNLNWPKI